MSNWIFDTRLGIVSLSRYLFSEHNYRVYSPTKSSLWGEKLGKSLGVSRQYELKRQPPFIICIVHVQRQLKTCDEKQTKPTMFAQQCWLSCLLSTLYPGGYGKRRSQGKKRRDRWDGKDSQLQKGKEWVGVWSKGDSAGARTGVIENTKNGSRLPLIFSSL